MDRGMIDLPSPYSVPDTVARLESILKERGLTIFARVDHSGEAERVGLKMRPTQLLIFGSPKGGSTDGRGSQRGDRSSAQGFGLGR
jgi:uncharacterized protein (DUF302 family)